VRSCRFVHDWDGPPVAQAEEGSASRSGSSCAGLKVRGRQSEPRRALRPSRGALSEARKRLLPIADGRCKCLSAVGRPPELQHRIRGRSHRGDHDDVIADGMELGNLSADGGAVEQSPGAQPSSQATMEEPSLRGLSWRNIQGRARIRDQRRPTPFSVAWLEAARRGRRSRRFSAGANPGRRSASGFERAGAHSSSSETTRRGTMP